MKSFSIALTVRELLEIRNLLFTIVAETDVLQTLSYSELTAFQKGFTKLIGKCQTAIFKKQNRSYQVSFVPMEAEVFVRIFLANPLPLTTYASNTVSRFMSEVDRQSKDLKTTFLSQFPLQELKKKFNDY